MKKSKVFLMSITMLLNILIAPGIGVSANEVDTCNLDNDSFDILFRLYNPNTGEHLYTSDDYSRDTERSRCIVAGWRPEDIAWTTATQTSSNTPIYRLYNPNNGGDHHYTTSLEEYNETIKAGWKGEGVAFYSDDDKGIPVYREYNPNAASGMHNWTTSLEEHNALIKVGWKDEGIAYYAIDSGHKLLGKYFFHDFYSSTTYTLKKVICEKCDWERSVVTTGWYKDDPYGYWYLINNYPLMAINKYDMTTWREFLDYTGFGKI